MFEEENDAAFLETVLSKWDAERSVDASVFPHVLGLAKIGAAWKARVIDEMKDIKRLENVYL